MTRTWNRINTSKHSIEFRTITKHRLNEQLAALLAIRRRALANARPHVILKATSEKDLQPQATPAPREWGQFEPQATDSSHDHRSSIPKLCAQSSPEIYGDDDLWTITESSRETLAKSQITELDKTVRVLEQPHTDTFPARLEQILDANDTAKTLIKKYRDTILGVSEEGPGMPSIETRIKDRIRLFIKDPDEQKEAYENTLRDGQVIMDHCPEDDEYDPPLINGFEFSGLMKGRNPRYPVGEDDIERLDDIIAEILSAKEKSKDGIMDAESARDTHKMRWRSNELGGGTINFMKSKGRGSALRQCTQVDDEWPDEWTLSMEGESRRIMSRYEEAAEEMRAADALRKHWKRRSRDPKW